ncbi:MAG: sigma-70 family RNA polymerase sigma factor [Prolixibacteraceae bacterium]|jgi:RNA polymerase sigma-70 factor (ECF subfamily)|nr:sigma-70 family RNA polymerase sigma factor [Prolixibacteraceae bacterium]MDI9563060.1 sigma-70 family RNA polymerase sigma factor [Bacteroidota bacterium]NLS98821.1 sigma-70 family RNA polymerase sigma factor [Bacteroidales bacterium]OQB80656.1 MAG: ECF RNA polymerase sigma-E factor [Bacteroidetes bacterium ADurb.Bin123]HNU77406.1 sigma-70 family RNA polymerase sigma factor [Prolixibacteraceae bacterium]
MQNSDQELTENLRKEETRDRAFQELVLKYQERLYWHIRKIVLNHDDADDVLQNTFLKVWRNIGQFREESSLFTWLYRIATNESLTFINSRKRHTLISMNDVSDYLKDRLESDEFFEGSDIQKKLQSAIVTLPEKQRLVFNMRYFGEIPYQEMSEILNTSVGALKASYHHAVKKVEDYISNLE